MARGVVVAPEIREVDFEGTHPNSPPTFLFECTCLTVRTTALHPRLRDDIRESANVGVSGPTPRLLGNPRLRCKPNPWGQWFCHGTCVPQTGKRQFPRTPSPGANAETRNVSGLLIRQMP